MTIRFTHTLTILLALFVGALGLFLNACDMFKERFYYSFHFEAEVEGELFAFETKVTCEPVTTGRMGLFKRMTFYYAQMAAYGFELKSGKGFFVSTPDMCPYLTRGLTSRKWTFSGARSVIPLMFFSDTYSNANHVRVIVDPEGPSPKTGVKLIAATVTPLTGVDVLKTKNLPPDKNNPLIESQKRNWFGFVLFPLQNDLQLEDGDLLPWSKESRFQVFRLGPKEIREISNELDKKPWANLKRGVPVDDFFAPQGDDENPREVVDNKQEATKWGWKNLVSLELDGPLLKLDSSVKGTINFYERDLLVKYLSAPGERGVRVDLEGVEGKVGETHRDITFLLLYDRETNQAYLAQRVSFGLKFRK